eukprot:TRINITY_DN2584_c0_g1_i9.p2 TRINITY_DN2584_c0_g1~~TRINITY_DN2584_c0_g1_i9.p2  ORF type:complete len:193 (-),score=27.86 TRINITY_DN2584_c0_g1_i9:266-844(-)
MRFNVLTLFCVFVLSLIVEAKYKRKLAALWKKATKGMTKKEKKQFFRKLFRKVGRGVRKVARGVRRVGRRVIRAGRRVVRRVARVGKNIGKRVVRVGKKVGRGVIRVAKKTARVAKKAAVTIGKGAMMAAKVATSPQVAGIIGMIHPGAGKVLQMAGGLIHRNQGGEEAVEEMPPEVIYEDGGQMAPGMVAQ